MKTLIACTQMTSTKAKAENIDHAYELIREAAIRGVKLIGLPENFAYMGDNSQESAGSAELIDGPTIAGLKKCAKQNHIWVSLGGFLERAEDDRVYNSHLIISDDGQIVANYRKIHLFSAQLSNGGVYDEARYISAGSAAITAVLPFFTLGLTVCYDLRFPALFASLRDLGAELLLVPSAFTETTGKAHWEILLRARAIETQSYVLAAAQIGKHSQERRTHGRAMIVDPWGIILAQCGEHAHLAIAEIDLDYLNLVRKSMPVWHHRRAL